MARQIGHALLCRHRYTLRCTLGRGRDWIHPGNSAFDPRYGTQYTLQSTWTKGKNQPDKNVFLAASCWHQCRRNKGNTDWPFLCPCDSWANSCLDVTEFQKKVEGKGKIPFLILSYLSCLYLEATDIWTDSKVFGFVHYSSLLWSRSQAWARSQGASKDKWSQQRSSAQEMWSDPCHCIIHLSQKMKCLSCQDYFDQASSSFLSPHLLFLQFEHCPISILLIYVVHSSWPFYFPI